MPAQSALESASAAVAGRCPGPRPFRLFALRSVAGDGVGYPQARFVHLAGMVRHLAIKSMLESPPPGRDRDWILACVAGHRPQAAPLAPASCARPGEHRQFSYLPLPFLARPHADPSIRHILITAPPDDEDALEHLARTIDGRPLKPERGNEFPGRLPPCIARLQDGADARCYTDPADVWHSFTPVILPGHNDHKPAKTRRLIEKALVQSGIDLPCTVEWSPVSHFPAALPSHSQNRGGHPTGYIRPTHLLSLTATHLSLVFHNGVLPAGPLAIGAGRHCGFGLLAHSMPVDPSPPRAL